MSGNWRSRQRRSFLGQLKSINGARLEEPLAHQNATPQLRFFSLFSMKRKVREGSLNLNEVLIKNLNIGTSTEGGTTALTGEQAQATLRGRPLGRLGTDGSSPGCLRGRPRRLGSIQG